MPLGFGVTSACRASFHLWFIGFRFGEALHPGPPASSAICLAVINPTTILDKEWHVNQVGADVLIASETSANARVQDIMSTRLRGSGFRCLWGHPTETRHHACSGKAMLRSYALGVAVFSKLPCRPAVQPLPKQLALSCRISECFVRLHCLEVKVISIYGVPRCLPEAAAKNNLLLAWALQRATISCVPALVAGDFNTCPTDLPAWQAFQGLGWVELGAFAAQVHDIHLPCTCKGATRFDTFLLLPSIFQFFSSADVIAEEHLFDSHAPMRLHLRMPGQTPSKWIWPLPRTFDGLMLDSTSLSRSYNQVVAPLKAALSAQTSEQQEGDKLRLWSVAVEEAVSRVISREHSTHQGQNFRCLPRSCRGRCKDVERKIAAPPRLPRPARQGDPAPFDEDTSVLGRQRLRQLRRLTTFKQGLHKFYSGRYQGQLQASGWPVSLDLEWRAICRASGYGSSFPGWAVGWPCFDQFPLHRPSLDFVEELTSLVRFDTEAVQKQAVATKCKLFKFQLQVDAQEFGGSRSFVRLRPPQKPPFTCVLNQTRQAATLTHRHSFHWCTFSVPAPSAFEPLCKVYCAQVAGQVTSIRENKVTVLFPSDDDIVLPLQGFLCRSHYDTSWPGVVASLMEFWSPIWNRDSVSEETDIECWPRYKALVALLQSPCAQIEVDMTNVAAWKHVARRLSPGKATGVCGWHNKDLRLLPEAALADLAMIMQQLLATGFPCSLMQARVAVLSKVLAPVSADQARPITILSCLYRLWARVLCTQVIQSWSLSLPRSITGCVKGRSALDLSYEVQALVEQSLHEGTDLSGLCLDLKKAFNFLPRAPLGDLLCRLGVPFGLAKGWQASLTKVKRCFQVAGSLSPAVSSTTGAPEGDPASVLGMITVCWLFVTLLQGVVQPRAYVDNWSWSSDAPDNHAPALLILDDIVQALSLQIDWTKTYQWATSAVSRSWWTEVGSAFLPTGTCLVRHVKELGSYYQFTKKRALGPFHQRLQDALQRLTRLASDPQDLPTRAKVVHNGVWPFLFFGTEGLLPSLTTVTGLRSAAARAVVGQYQPMSPHAALCFVQGVQDPEVFLLCHHVSQLRRAFRLSPETAALIWDRLLGPPIPSRAVCGPAGALQALLARNDWTVLADGTFKGPLHCSFNLHQASTSFVRAMFDQAWASMVQDNLLHRNGMASAPTPHVAMTQAALARFRPWEQRFLARNMCGGFFSGAEKNTWSRESTGECPLCSALDTRAHRIFTCPALREKREAHQSTLDLVARDFPTWTYMPYVAWPFEASVLQLFLSRLRLPDLAPPPDRHPRFVLFTDASAINTTCPTARLTAWAVVLGRPPAHAPHLQESDLHEDALLPCFSVLGQGSTPGQQTVPRAELAALAWVCKWQYQCPEVEVTVHCDCQPALDLWNRWLLQGWLSVSSCANADLLQDLPRDTRVKAVKIKAHRSETVLQQASLWERWLAAGNEAADAAAKQACSDIPLTFREMAGSAADQCRSQSQLLSKFLRALLDLGVLDAGKRKSEERLQTAAAAASPQTGTLEETLDRIREWRVPVSGHSSFPPSWEENWAGWSFGLAYGRHLVLWLQTLRWHVQPAPPAATWTVSFLEMLLSFCEFSATPPLVENVFQPGSYWDLVTAAKQLQHISLRQLVVCFKAALQRMGQLLRYPVFPCVEVKDVPHLRLFNVVFPSPGLAARPALPGTGWPTLLRALADADNQVDFLSQVKWA